MARFDRLDISGQPNNAEVEALMNSDRELAKPLDDERMTIQTRKRNGVVENRDVKVGDTMNAFQRLLENKRSELQGLLLKLQGVDDEIKESMTDIAQTESNEMKKSKNELNVVLEAMADKARSSKSQTKSEIRKAQKEEKALSDQFNHRLQGIMD